MPRDICRVTILGNSRHLCKPQPSLHLFTGALGEVSRGPAPRDAKELGGAMRAGIVHHKELTKNTERNIS